MLLLEHFWEFGPPPYMRAQKSFFCVKIPKTKPKTIFFSPKGLFQVFRLSTREMSFSNLALFENAQNLRDKFWNLVPENRVLASKRAPFYFWRVFRSVALRDKIWHRLRPSESAKSDHFPTNCLDLDGFWTFVDEFPKISAAENLKMRFFVFLTR